MLISPALFGGSGGATAPEAPLDDGGACGNADDVAVLSATAALVEDAASDPVPPCNINGSFKASVGVIRSSGL